MKGEELEEERMKDCCIVETLKIVEGSKTHIHGNLKLQTFKVEPDLLTGN